MTEKKSFSHNETIQKNDKVESKKKRNFSSTHRAVRRHHAIYKFVIIASFCSVIGGGFLWVYWENKQRQDQIIILREKITDLQTSLTEKTKKDNDTGAMMQNELTSLHNYVADQRKFIAAFKDTLALNSKSIQKISERLSAMSPTETNNWLISEANYLVTLAGRKIWQDRDFVTARLLLKSANNNLASTNDPSLLPARKAISHDLMKLTSISQLDLNGIVFQLMSLANQVSALPLVKNYDQIGISIEQHDDSFTNPQTNDVIKDTSTTFLSQLKLWSNNISKNFRIFLRNFIQINRYNEFTDCVIKAGDDKKIIDQCRIYRGLITPEQSLYLRENMRLQLYIASQAALRHQNDLYQQGLNDVSNSIYAYFDLHSPATYSFLNDINDLKTQSINYTNLPDSLESAVALDKVMQTRIRSLLTAQ